jgi:hypothetical protein
MFELRNVRYKLHCIFACKPLALLNSLERRIEIGKTKFRHTDNLVDCRRKCSLKGSWFSHMSRVAGPEAAPSTAWKAVPLRCNGIGRRTTIGE